jgi:hypothetical protein
MSSFTYTTMVGRTTMSSFICVTSACCTTTSSFTYAAVVGCPTVTSFTCVTSACCTAAGVTCACLTVCSDRAARDSAGSRFTLATGETLLQLI